MEHNEKRENFKAFVMTAKGENSVKNKFEDRKNESKNNNHWW